VGKALLSWWPKECVVKEDLIQGFTVDFSIPALKIAVEVTPFTLSSHKLTNHLQIHCA
jgi:hypothetical protein